MNSCHLILPGKISPRLSRTLAAVNRQAGPPQSVIRNADQLPDLAGQRLLLAIQLDQAGGNPALSEILSCLADRGDQALEGCTGALIVASPNDFYTKSTAQSLIFLLNRLGCRFIGHPLTEATGDLANLRKWQQETQTLEDVFVHRCREEVWTLLHDQPALLPDPKILALHASSRKTSNTVMLWDMVKKHLAAESCQVEELNVAKGMVLDCRGCTYQDCLHYSQQDSCYYGGAVIREILPAMEKADAIVWICPNYNDAISANLMAVINRMTALYRKHAFYQKTLFGIIVSGNSGGDAVARQLIGALNINKGFRLPPRFALFATANDPGEIRQVPGIQEEARRFAAGILGEIKA